MEQFAALLDALVYTRSRNGKLALIADYLRRTPDPDRGWALAALTDGLDFKAVKAGTVRALIMERVDPELFALSRDFVGDTAETVSLLWPEPHGSVLAPPSVSEAVAAKDFATRLRHITAAADPREPDLVLLAADGYTFTDSLADQDTIIPNDPPKGAHGHDHLMPNMYGCCVISGAGIAKAKVIDEVQNVDITPTMARLLGIPFPDADGKVIEAALAK